ncbi:haloacid dehalogenase-like hydrolase [Verrucomicrobiaceae bacterium R5-34]|uniref:Haloacid dehalogenase-like hydrolase n=1 Tax=Oceaniferula flava TaxID=2800421 RepID=A0AAE2SB22_9BACT|nr:HAD-IB family hydrolase [Oceaniferula flavus]MBK1830275.1 haloacid dehalogenase-like hydrolase [Verrucomicrobiaceae bacterium R5-34]MBK1854866.1 haloacid dehalogenase-like hydrolase [Oceaniferula flavus]MBM1136172.1 haloacid dehalogenase-like hydrolase [Oceaniferula flavus]
MPPRSGTPEPATGYALFDLDQTLIPWDTQLLFCNFVLKRMPWRRFYLLILIPFLPLTKILGAGGMKRVFLNYLWGMDRATLEQLGEEFVEEIFPAAFYPEMLEVVKREQASGRLMVLSSASPDIWVKPIARKLGFDHCFGTELEIDGRVKLFPDLHGGNNKGANKLVKMRAILPRGYDPAAGQALPNSHGFSDSHADLPMLCICENASMVNPTDKLHQVGKQRHWELHTPPRPTRGKRQFAIACLRQALGIYSA